MADGILEAALVTYEGRYRPDQEPYEPWLDFQRGKIQRARSDVGRAAGDRSADGRRYRPGRRAEQVDEQYDWRPEFPALVAWLEKFNATHPAFADSRPSD